MSEQSHKTLRATFLFGAVALIVWYLFSTRKGESTTVIYKDTVVAKSVTIYQPTETRVFYRDTTIIEKRDTFSHLDECQEAYEQLWTIQMGLSREYHAIREYDTTFSDTNYIIKSHIQIQDNRLLSYRLTPTIINTNTVTNKYKFSPYVGLYVNNMQNQNSYGAIVTIPVRDLQFSVGHSISDRGWFGSIQTRIFSK
jgi:hypothetical protein